MEKYTLEGIDGNAFAIIGYVQNAMKRERFPEWRMKEYNNTAKCGDYYNLIQTSYEQVEEVNDFVRFWEEFSEDYSHVTVNKSVAAEYFLREDYNTENFYNYVLANGLCEVEE